MKATDVLDEAAAAGVPLRGDEAGGVRVLVPPSDVPPDLLVAMRAHKAELAALLAGDVCRWCGGRMDWPRAAGVVLGDGTAMHTRCSEEFHIARVMRLARNAHTPDAMADQAEVMIQGRII